MEPFFLEFIAAFSAKCFGVAVLWCLNIIFPRNHLSVKLCGT